MNNYTTEQIKDISERIAKANNYLAELKLSIVVNIEPVMLPDNVFAFRANSMFYDQKYKEETKEQKVDKIVEGEVVKNKK